MATRRNRVNPQSVGLRSPQAATFQAQNVPHVGAQKRSGVGDNARRLADSLGQFNSALRGFGASMSAQMKEHEAKAGEMAGLYEQTNFSSEEERQAHHMRNGTDPIGDIYTHISYVENQEVPKRRNQLSQDLAAANANSWMVPTGQTRVTVDEEGNETEEPVLVNMTDEMLINERFEKNRAVDAAYLGKPELAKVRDSMLALNDAEYKAKMKALGEYRQEERISTAKQLVFDYGPKAISGAAAVYKGDPDAMVANTLKEFKQISKEVAGELSDDDIIDSTLKSLPKRVENDPQLARQALEFISGKVAKDTSSIANHPKFMTQAGQVATAAYNAIAEEEANTEYEKTMSELSAHFAEGGSIASIEVSPIKVKGGSREFGFTTKEIKSEYARRRDAAVLKNTENFPKEAIPEVLVMDSANSGLPSPMIQNMLAGFTLDPDESRKNPDEMLQSYAAYDALRRHDPLHVDQYVKDGQARAALADIRLLVNEKGMSPVDAAQVVYNYTQEGTIDPFLKRHAEAFKDFRDTTEIRDTFTANEVEDIIRSSAILHAQETGLKDRDLEEYLMEIAKDRKGMKPEVYGRSVDLHPSEENVPRAVTKMTWATDHAAELVGLDPKNVKTIRSGNVHYFVDARTKFPLLGPNGNWVQMDQGTLTTEFESMVTAAREGKLDEAIANKYGLDYNSSARRIRSSNDAEYVNPYDDLTAEKFVPTDQPKGKIVNTPKRKTTKRTVGDYRLDRKKGGN